MKSRHGQFTLSSGLYNELATFNKSPKFRGFQHFTTMLSSYILKLATLLTLVLFISLVHGATANKKVVNFKLASGLFYSVRTQVHTKTLRTQKPLALAQVAWEIWSNELGLE